MYQLNYYIYYYINKYTIYFYYNFVTKENSIPSSFSSGKQDPKDTEFQFKGDRTSAYGRHIYGDPIEIADTTSSLPVRQYTPEPNGGVCEENIPSGDGTKVANDNNEIIVSPLALNYDYGTETEVDSDVEPARKRVKIEEVKVVEEVHKEEDVVQVNDDEENYDFLC